MRERPFYLDFLVGRLVAFLTQQLDQLVERQEAAGVLVRLAKEQLVLARHFYTVQRVPPSSNSVDWQQRGYNGVYTCYAAVRQAVLANNNSRCDRPSDSSSYRGPTRLNENGCSNVL